MKDREENRGASSLDLTSEKLCFQLTRTTYPGNLGTWDKNPLGRPLGKMNWTSYRFQGSRASGDVLDNTTQLFSLENITTLKIGTGLKELSSLGTAATAVSSSIGVVALILLLVGLLSMTLKKWRHERLFRKQLKHQTNLLHKSLELSCHADAIYSNVINLAPRKEDDFAVYANVPPFDRPRRTSPDKVEYASIVFH
ncbi:hypothetical protein E2I00_011789 [Balaenoptera physalus]|uniref:Uncharacterized protein n=1 Tax=Balaenoptera physalus TaxID=9770 RepID=A0A643BQA1_BALPH|nr:hypothetical protein E2I00_011789 [Balaenoptera physalus]